MSINMANLRKRYQTYARAPKRRQRLETSKDDHTGTTDPVSIANIIAIIQTPRSPIIAATKWFNHETIYPGTWSILN